MKRLIYFILVCVLCLSLCACGKSEAVKNVEAMIDTLVEITLESIDAIHAAENAFNALTEDEQKQVRNQKNLTKAKDAYYELALVGEWAELYIDVWDIEGLYNKVRLSLNADMSGIDYKDGSFSWEVKGGILRLDYDGEGDICPLNISEESSCISLHLDGWNLLPVKDFHALLDDMFLIVDLADTDITDYCEFYMYKSEGIDAWGAPTGSSSESIRIGSKAYRDGWCYFDAKDVAIEIFLPAYEEIHKYSDGTSSTYTYDACALAADHKNLFIDTLMGIKSTGSKDDWHKTLTIDQLSFGRAKGSLYFVNLD